MNLLLHSKEQIEVKKYTFDNEKYLYDKMLEDNWKLYFNNVKTRCLKLIEFGIWSGIDRNKLEAWLNNFKTDQEKFFSACVLDSLIFRSNEQIISMLYDLLTRDLNNLFRLESTIYDKNTNPLSLLKDKWTDPRFRVVAAVKGNDPPSKSGYLISGHLVHSLNVNEKWTIKPEMIDLEINKGVKNFVLIDDILCTGKQICETIMFWNLDKISNVNFYIAVCVGHESGIKKLQHDYPNIKIAFTEKLIYSDSFFENLDIQNTDYLNKEDAIIKYKEFLKSKGVKNTDLRLW